ncbi:MAG: hypothetical protein Q9165_002567 [Trypethelium subeluteriae]
MLDSADETIGKIPLPVPEPVGCVRIPLVIPDTIDDCATEMTLLRSEATGAVTLSAELMIAGVEMPVVGRPSVPVETVGTTVFKDVVGKPSVPVVMMGTRVFEDVVGRPSVPVVIIGTTVAELESDPEAPVPDGLGGEMPEVIGSPVPLALVPGSVMPEVRGNPVPEALIPEREIPEVRGKPVPEVPGKVRSDVSGRPVPEGRLAEPLVAEPDAPVPGILTIEVSGRLVTPLVLPIMGGIAVSEVVLMDVSGEEVWLSPPAVVVSVPVPAVVPVPTSPEDTPDMAEEMPEVSPETTDDTPDARPEVTDGIIPPVPVAPVTEMPVADVEVSPAEGLETPVWEEPGSREAVEAPDDPVFVPKIVDNPTMIPLELDDEALSALEELAERPVGSSVVSGRPEVVPTNGFVVSVVPVAELEVLPDGETGLAGTPPVDPIGLDSSVVPLLVRVLCPVDVSESAEETPVDMADVALDTMLLALETREESTDDRELVGGTMGTTVEPPVEPTTVVEGIEGDSSELEAELPEELEALVDAVG